MYRVLVVYATKSGCTEGIAERIGARLAEKGAMVDVRSADDAPSASGYDAVVVGSGVRAGTWHASARAWVAANAASLRATPLAFYTCGLMIREGEERIPEVRAYSKPVEEAHDLSPVDVGLFAGWNQPDSFNLLERSMLKMMKLPVGDFRDFGVVDEWSDKVAAPLGLVA